MLKKLKWVLLVLLSIGIILLTYVVTLLNYAEAEVETLAFYQLAIQDFPEVASVEHIHRFNGIRSYIVANVVLETGYHVYYFIYGDTVESFSFASLLITETEARTIAQNLVPHGEIINTQLGILNGIPIFEVQIREDHVVYYIVIYAETGEIKMNFQV